MGQGNTKRKLVVLGKVIPSAPAVNIDLKARTAGGKKVFFFTHNVCERMKPYTVGKEEEKILRRAIEG